LSRIHPTAVLGPGVELGEDNVIGPNAVILGPTTLGDGNWVAPGAVIGGPAEMRGVAHPAAWEGELRGGGIHIGDRNVLREHVVVHAPHEGETLVGDDCYLMNKVYVPHDAHLEDGVVMAASVLMGGHCRVGAGANLGLGAMVHQRLVVGPGAMAGMGSVVTRPIPPFALAYGTPARVAGVNRVGMRRAGIAEDVIAELAAAYEVDPTGDGFEVPEVLQAAFEWYRAQF
jgi:UDP-N-acetylglucosamine acyltransferase